MNERVHGNTIQDKIDEDYKAAFKAKDEPRFKALRPVLAKLKQETIDRRHELSDEEIQQVLRTEIKSRKDATEQFKQGGREDLVEQAAYEISLIESYLPAQMPDEHLEAIVRETLAAIGASSPADMGKAMGAVMAKVKGQADGGRVKAMVEKVLNG